MQSLLANLYGIWNRADYRGYVTMLLLKATEHNWGLIGPGDWDRHSWKIDDDGWCQYKEIYRSGGTNELPEIPVLVKECVLSGEQMRRLHVALVRDWSDDSTDALDMKPSELIRLVEKETEGGG